MIVGYSLNLVREGLRDRRKRLREREAREFRLRVRSEARQSEFRRKAAAELKDALQKHYRILRFPSEEPEHQRDWFFRLHENRVNVLSLAAAVGDGELSQVLHRICET